MNYFISKEDDICTSKSGVKDYLTENGLLEIEVFEAKRITNDVYFFCKKYNDSFLKGVCGNYCDGYIPKNGKSGCCLYFRNCYECKTKKLKLN